MTTLRRCRWRARSTSTLPGWAARGCGTATRGPTGRSWMPGSLPAGMCESVSRTRCLIATAHVRPQTPNRSLRSPRGAPGRRSSDGVTRRLRRCSNVAQGATESRVSLAVGREARLRTRPLRHDGSADTGPGSWAVLLVANLGAVHHDSESPALRLTRVLGALIALGARAIAPQRLPATADPTHHGVVFSGPGSVGSWSTAR